jgi:hypothetical protein
LNNNNNIYINNENSIESEKNEAKYGGTGDFLGKINIIPQHPIIPIKLPLKNKQYPQ